MPLEYRKLQEHQIRLLTLEPRDKGHSTVHCRLEDEFFLQDSFLTSNGPIAGKKIPFEGLIGDRYPEYLHVHTQRKEQKKSLRNRGKARLQRAFGIDSSEKYEETDKNPMDHPDDFNFRIAVGRPSLRNFDPTPTAASLPQNWTPRYAWGDFVALSYAWGVSNNTREIIVNGEKQNVTLSLYEALTALQKHDCFHSGLKIWADALCLNQKDSTELEIQCLKMDQIYRTAGNVVVWLGPDQVYDELSTNICSKHAISYLQWLSVYFRNEILETMDRSSSLRDVLQYREIANSHLRQSLHMITSEIKQNFNHIDIDEYGWLSVFHFFDNEYWKRLWIIQELVMGNQDIAIFCGSQVTGWRHVRDSALIIAQVSDFVSNKIRAFALKNNIRLPDLSARRVDHVAAIAELGIRSHRKKLPQIPRDEIQLAFTSRPGPEELPRLRGSGILQLLALASDAHCLLPADRVFGLLQVLPLRRPDPNTLATDSLRELYLQFALHCVSNGELSRELGDSDYGNASETTRVTQDGTVIASSTITKYNSQGIASSLDIFSLLDGIMDPLILPSWAPNLARPSWRKTTPFLGPWHASGMGQGVPVPQIIHEINGITTPTRLLALQGGFVDTIDGLGAIQCMMQDCIDLRSSTEEDCLAAATQLAKSMGSARGQLPDKALPGWYGPSFTKGLVQPTAIFTKSEEYIREALPMALVGGADYHGNAIDPRYLLTSLSMGKPAQDATDTDCWNWDFVKSSEGLKLGSKTLSEYFTEPSPPVGSGLASALPYHDPDGLMAAKSSMTAKTRGRRVFVTKDRSLIGLGPMAMCKGDFLAILVGLNRPVIIRRHLPFEGHMTWLVIGECFVHGVMEGEFAQIGFLNATERILFC